MGPCKLKNYFWHFELKQDFFPLVKLFICKVSHLYQNHISCWIYSSQGNLHLDANLKIAAWTWQELGFCDITKHNRGLFFSALGCVVDLLPSISQFVEGISGDDVAADELHRWIAFWGLLPEDRAGKHWVVPALLPQVDFNLQLQTQSQESDWWGKRTDRHSWKVNSKRLTGNSSLCVQTPLHCLCSITCLIFISTGNAIQPDAKLQANKR